MFKCWRANLCFGIFPQLAETGKTAVFTYIVQGNDLECAVSNRMSHGTDESGPALSHCVTCWARFVTEKTSFANSDSVISRNMTVYASHESDEGENITWNSTEGTWIVEPHLRDGSFDGEKRMRTLAGILPKFTQLAASPFQEPCWLSAQEWSSAGVRTFFF